MVLKKKPLGMVLYAHRANYLNKYKLCRL